METKVLTKSGIQSVNLNRRRAIRYRCMDCSGFERNDVQNCTHVNDCSLYPFRMGTGKQNAVSRNRAIKEYCMWCMVDQTREVERCSSIDCPLFQFRGYLRQKQHIEALTDTISPEVV